VPGFRQGLGGDRQIELVALRGEIVDREIDLLFVSAHSSQTCVMAVLAPGTQ
jgi:hypothetical protein